MFKIGDKVKVIRRSVAGEIHWNPLMDKAIGKVYTILRFSHLGRAQLNSELDTQYNFLYPIKGISKVKIKGQQLLFNFMEG